MSSTTIILFLCAAMLMGQSNMAAGATIGSNHNSRSADGEIAAGRGFWPGLCVSLKHNSKFASFTLIAKGDFPAELNIPIPFSLVSNDVSNDQLVVMPAYWLMYNMYALARNEAKYASRDNRKDKTQEIEYDFLAPDSVNEIFDALQLMKLFTAKAHAKSNKKRGADASPDIVRLVKKGELLLEDEKEVVTKLEILAEGFENSQRKVELIKVPEAYHIFKELIIYYGVTQLIRFIEHRHIVSWQKLVRALPAKPIRDGWKNIGGQLMTAASVATLTRNIRSGKIKSWDEVHDFYNTKSGIYRDEKFRHAFASLLEVLKLTPKKFTRNIFIQLLQQAITTKEWMVKGIYDSRAKDYQSPFRQMLYETRQELDKVIGKLADNSFIKQQQEDLLQFRGRVNEISRQFLKPSPTIRK